MKRNAVAKDLRTPKYRMRVVCGKKGVDLGNGERNMSRNLSKLSKFCLTRSKKGL